VGAHRHQQRRERGLLELVEPDIHVRVVLGAVERLPAVVGDLGDLLQAPLRHIGEPRQVQRHAPLHVMSRNMRHEGAPR